MTDPVGPGPLAPGTTGIPAEPILWQGRSSQLLNFWVFLIAVLLCWLIIPVFWALWRYLLIRCRVYEITSERIRITDGVLSKKREEIELYRVRDTSFVQPFLLRLFSLGNIVIKSSDKTIPWLCLPAIADAESIRELIRKYVEIRRDQKGIKELDIE